ncbi:GATA transcription factor 26-like [Rhodamnia argentea]|uniref:GATA transcription factor 26-like n=1 Tax=Rhodamnia argentea TaxID=178133 RepID=A0A8B8PG98_9MYRT|nr:GATA transcription factor 26-like [Rhodamnia argentea]XP_048131728.1 GATA transcription factor 26-like [Rhodamnia argentea]
MVKQGPCYHCGVTSTPLWRNGPPEKPVLCNACGSRWRTKGTLANYAPLHSRADSENYEDHRVARTKGVSMNKKEVKVLKRKYYGENMTVGGNSHEYSQNFHKFADDDTSNWSSSGSALSNSESCAPFGSADASDLTGPAQSVVWDSLVPSRKRTCVNRSKPSAVEKLTRDLHTILHEQQSSCLSGSSEEDLLLESETPMVSVEIGHGSVLIRHPSSIAREEESEASSLSVDNKQLKQNGVHYHPLTIPVHKKCVNLLSSKAQTLESPFAQGKEQGQLKRDKSQHEKLHMLGTRSSPLLSIELRDVLNFDQFVKYLTYEEQQQLLKYLPQVDRANFPDSLRSMFDGAAFLENLSSFQHLLTEGVFDISSSVAKDEDYRTLRKLVLAKTMKCKWVEHYHQVKKLKSGSGSPGSQGGRETVSSNLIKGKGLHDIQKQKYTEVNAKIKSPRRLIMGGSSKNKEIAESDGSCFSPRSLFAVPPDGGALLLDSLHAADDNSEQDLLLDVPSNGSFPQAELLHPAMSFVSQQASTSRSSQYPQLVHP